MSKGSTRAAQAAAEAAEARALLAEQAARPQREAEEDRVWRDQQLEAFRREIERDRAAQVRASMEATPPVTLLRDQGTGGWLPAAPQSEPEPDPAAMSMAEYVAWRSADNVRMDQRCIEQTGRTGKHLGADSGFPDWRDMSSGSRVFRGQLPDQRKPIPVGHVRPDTGEWS